MMECAHCEKTFLKRHSLVQHLRNHCTKNDAGLKFPSLTDFQEWKDKLEEESCCYFIKRRKEVVRKLMVTRQYYECNRSGVFKKHGKGLKRLKSQGTCKIGKKCPARITAHLNMTDGSVSVKKYNFEHNHETAMQHLRIQKTARDSIAGKLSEGITKQRILDDVRDDCAQSGKVNRNSLVTMKDLTNIERDYNIKGNIQRHQADAISIQLWVEECQKQPQSNPVLFFKNQDDDDPLERFEKKDYVLIIMSPFQKEMLSKFGCDKICIDGTHGTNPYDFTLHTLLIIDEFNNGCPVAFCISNTKTQVLYKTFFQYVKEEAGLIKSKIFMSDDEPAYYNAWKEVMGASEHRLMCTWHVYENWKKNLGKISSSETKKEVFRMMKILQKETNVDNFNKMLNNFILGLDEDETLHSFKDYFVKTYSTRCEMWAACFRKYIGLNTNMHLESLHKRIKYHCLGGTCNRRLDLTIDALLKMIRDFAFQRMIKITKKAPHAKIKQIDDSHQRSEGLTSTAIPVENDETTKWSVTSATRNEVTYIIERSGTTACDCNYRCSACNICIHMFTCSCPNNVINFTICKHIHAVAKSLAVEVPIQTANDEQQRTLENLVSLLPPKEVFTNSSTLQTKLESLLVKVMKLQRNTINEKKIEKLHKNVNECLLICDELQ